MSGQISTNIVPTRANFAPSWPNFAGFGTNLVNIGSMLVAHGVRRPEIPPNASASICRASFEHCSRFCPAPLPAGSNLAGIFRACFCDARRVARQHLFSILEHVSENAGWWESRRHTASRLDADNPEDSSGLFHAGTHTHTRTKHPFVAKDNETSLRSSLSICAICI